MALRDEFNAALKEAMKAKEARRVSTLRMILAAMKDQDIAARTETSREGISDDDVLSLLAKMIKQRDEFDHCLRGRQPPRTCRCRA